MVLVINKMVAEENVPA